MWVINIPIVYIHLFPFSISSTNVNILTLRHLWQHTDSKNKCIAQNIPINNDSSFCNTLQFRSTRDHDHVCSLMGLVPCCNWGKHFLGCLFERPLRRPCHGLSFWSFVSRSPRQLQTFNSSACKTPCKTLCSLVCPPAPTLSGRRRSAPSCETTAFIGESATHSDTHTHIQNN